MTDPMAMDCDAVRELAGLYALGALEPAEAAAVRDHLARCDDAHAELLEHGEVAGSLLLDAEPVEPPAGLKGRLMAAAEADLREGRHPSSTRAPATTPPPRSATAEPDLAPALADRPISLELARERRRVKLASLAAAAAVIVAVVFGGYAALLNNQLTAAEAYRRQVESVLKLAGQPGSATAVIAGADPGVSGLGVIATDGTVELAMRGLSPTPGIPVYAAWAIGADGTPVALGDFDVGTSGTGIAIGISPVTGAGTVLALTLEPQGGATTPTLPIVASGTAITPTS